MLKENLQIVNVNINNLIPTEYNPRKWSAKQMKDLKESIANFGLISPLLCNSAPERKNLVIGGHFRIAIVNELGMKDRIKNEIEQYHKFQAGVLGKSEKENIKIKDIDIRNYAKYILRERPIEEKRELLSNLRSKLIFKDKQLLLK